jgi:hypothetical protein
LKQSHACKYSVSASAVYKSTAPCSRRAKAQNAALSPDQSGIATARRRTVMAKGQMRSNKEKKKPKADKNKKKEGSSSSFGMAQNQGQPGSNPYGKKGP